MTPESRAMLEDWLANGSDVEKAHARNRLALERGEDMPGTPHAYPSIIAMAGNLAGTAAAFAASGFKLVSNAEKARRLAICHACLDYDPGPGKCRLCGCFSEVKARVGVADCPAGKWSPPEES